MFLLSDQIGNPLLKLDRDFAATYEFLWSHGMISDEVRLTIMSQCHFASLQNTSNACIDAIIETIGLTEYINSYHILLDLCYPSIVQQELRLKKIVSAFPYFLSNNKIMFINLPKWF